MTIAIIDYGSGNLHSATKAFERAARESGGNIKIVQTADADSVAKADGIVLPGVGAFADCRAGLAAVDGMEEALEEAVRNRARPFFGICVGTQMMVDFGLEKSTTKGFGWIGGKACPIIPSDPSLKIPHMGWNTINLEHPHPLLEGIETGDNGLHAYFVHSYHIEAENSEDVIATSDYGGPVTAMVGKDNMIGTQFHPEKSQKLGLALIANFLKWKP